MAELEDAAALKKMSDGVRTLRTCGFESHFIYSGYLIRHKSDNSHWDRPMSMNGGASEGKTCNVVVPKA